jgi:type IV pilus assembly protein PilM
MMRLTGAQIQPIGLDLGLDSIKMLQLSVADNSLSVVAAARQSLPAEVRNQPDLHLPAAMDVVRQMLRNNPFSGRRVVAALPRQIVHVKNIRLPLMPPAELATAVEFEARNIFPFDVEDAIVRYLPAGEVRQGSDSRMEIIALAAKRAEVDIFTEQLHRSGCVIESLDFEPSAIYRCIERYIRRREDENEVHVLAEIGARRTQVIIGKGRDISFYKPIDIGSQHLHEAVSRRLEISFAEACALRKRLVDAGETAPSATSDPVRQAVQDATRSTMEDLAREVSLCLRYYSVTFRGHRPVKLRVLGGEAGDPQLISIFASALPIPVEAGKPLANVNIGKMKPADRRGPMSEWAVAFGLSLKFTRGHFGSRDGTPRAAAKSSEAEVVDVDQAVEAAGRQQVEATHA